MERKICLGSWFWTFPSKVEVLHSYGKKRVADFRCCIWQSLGGALFVFEHLSSMLMFQVTPDVFLTSESL